MCLFCEILNFFLVALLFFASIGCVDFFLFFVFRKIPNCSRLNLISWCDFGSIPS